MKTINPRIYTIDGLLRQWSRKNPKVRNCIVRIAWPNGTIVEGIVDFSYVPGRGSMVRIQVTAETGVLLCERIVEARGYR